MPEVSLNIDYYCVECGELSPAWHHFMTCHKCGGRLRTKDLPTITGTRDGFGIKNEFYDNKTKKYITNRKEWEKAGFRDPLEVTTTHNVREGIKRKLDKIKHDKGRKKIHG